MCELLEVAGLQLRQRFVAQVLDEMQVVQHRRVLLFRLVVLVFENLGGAPGVAGEEQQEVVLEVEQRLLADLAGAVFDPAVGVEGEGRNAADRGDVLVLLADRLAELGELDFTGLGGEFGRGDDVLFVGVEALEQRGGEAAGRAEPGAAGNIGHRGEFEVRIGDAGELEGLPEDRVLDLVNRLHALELRVLEDDLLLEGPVLGQVDVLVDGRGHEEAAVLLVVRGQVGAATAKGDTQGRAGDDHGAKKE